MANLDIMKEGNTFAKRYELIRMLGRGGFSEVWLAKDLRTQGQLAIKVYATAGGIDSEGVKMFTQEFSVVTGINHTNLLRPTYFDEWNGIPYLTLPYCSRGSAFKYLSPDNKITEHECWQMLHDVSSGLAYLHAKNPVIIHQDIKPDNILINDEGRYMITDFGISKRIRRTFINATPEDNDYSSGTQAYMGPERFGTDRRPALANDIWSLGAMMFELMAGYAPFGEQGGLLQKKGAEVPVIHDEDYTEELKQIIYMCLSLETYNRPTAIQLSEYCDLRIKEITIEEVVKRQDNAFTQTLSRTLINYEKTKDDDPTEITPEPETTPTPGPTPVPKYEEEDEEDTTPPFWQKKKFWILICSVLCLAIISFFIFQRCQNREPEEGYFTQTDTTATDTIDSLNAIPATPIDTVEPNKTDNAEVTSSEEKEPIKVIRKSAHLSQVGTSDNSLPKPSPKPTGSFSINGATYSGDMTNGKPNGKGKLNFTSAQTYQKRQVQPGYTAEGLFENGRLVVGRIYDENGVKKYTVNYD